MKKEYEEEIFKEFPTLFPNGRNVDPRKSLLNYGLCIDVGWKDLLVKLCKDILKTENGDKVWFVQIKEKFGGLRAYIEGRVTRDIFNLTTEAEKESFNICEKCGEKGKLRQDNESKKNPKRLFWIKTLCDKHFTME